MRTNRYFISCQLFIKGVHHGNFTHAVEIANIDNSISIQDIVNTIQKSALNEINKSQCFVFENNDINYVSISLIDTFQQI